MESLEGAQHSGDELFFGESQKLGDFFSECENKQPELRNIFCRVDVSVQFASWLYAQSRSLFNIVQLTTGRLPRRHHFVNGPTTINLKRFLRIAPRATSAISSTLAATSKMWSNQLTAERLVKFLRATKFIKDVRQNEKAKAAYKEVIVTHDIPEKSTCTPIRLATMRCAECVHNSTRPACVYGGNNSIHGIFILLLFTFSSMPRPSGGAKHCLPALWTSYILRIPTSSSVGFVRKYRSLVTCTLSWVKSLRCCGFSFCYLAHRMTACAAHAIVLVDSRPTSARSEMCQDSRTS